MRKQMNYMSLNSASTQIVLFEATKNFLDTVCSDGIREWKKNVVFICSDWQRVAKWNWSNKEENYFKLTFRRCQRMFSKFLMMKLEELWRNNFLLSILLSLSALPSPDCLLFLCEDKTCDDWMGGEEEESQSEKISFVGLCSRNSFDIIWKNEQTAPWQCCKRAKNVLIVELR
jgi:hypothetical protein